MRMFFSTWNNILFFPNSNLEIIMFNILYAGLFCPFVFLTAKNRDFSVFRVGSHVDYAQSGRADDGRIGYSGLELINFIIHAKSKFQIVDMSGIM